MQRICDVRQHLQRKHRKPSHCPVCGIIFRGQRGRRDWREHIQRQACQKKTFQSPGISQDQWKKIDEHGEAEEPRAGTVYERRWYGIWDVLFPGPRFQRPQSPYSNSSAFLERIDSITESVAGDVQELVRSRPVEQRAYLKEMSDFALEQVKSRARQQEERARNSFASSQHQGQGTPPEQVPPNRPELPPQLHYDQPGHDQSFDQQSQSWESHRSQGYGGPGIEFIDPRLLLSQHTTFPSGQWPAHGPLEPNHANGSGSST